MLSMSMSMKDSDGYAPQGDNGLPSAFDQPIKQSHSRTSSVGRNDEVAPNFSFPRAPDVKSDLLKTGHQLPSPSPSPRSSSPSFVNDGTSSAEWEGPLNLAESNRLSGSHQRSRSGSNLDGNEDGTAIGSPLPISKSLPPYELEDIPEEVRKPRRQSLSKTPKEFQRKEVQSPRQTMEISDIADSKDTKETKDEKVLKLSPAEMHELTSEPESLPVIRSPRRAPLSPIPRKPSPVINPAWPASEVISPTLREDAERVGRSRTSSSGEQHSVWSSLGEASRGPLESPQAIRHRPGFSTRAISTPSLLNRKTSWTKLNGQNGTPQQSPNRSATRLMSIPDPLNLAPTLGRNGSAKHKNASDPLPHPSPLQEIPLPPMSIPTYLQLELASSRPSPLYVHRSITSDYPYESSKIKFERLSNFLLLPPFLEPVLLFGAFACLDAWLYTFTILPLRFVKAVAILVQWWGGVLARESRFISGFIYHGLGRMWHRKRGRRDSTASNTVSRSSSRASRPSMSAHPSFQTSRPPNNTLGNINLDALRIEIDKKPRSTWGRRHRRTKSVPSALSTNNKADILQGLVIVCSCLILLRLDGSRMYHSIRGQAAIKLYVIYNVLEVGDRLLSALGQDIFECLFSDETLDRKPDGRSKVLRPFGMFLLALAYNVIHATALFYQVITLNVAVNAYSNALLTLLMSNQFVEIKSTVFKKFEKENLFQLTCADVVERFQLWLMLMIIALRNIAEVGGLSVGKSSNPADEIIRNATVPLRTSILPNSFTLMPSWGVEVLTPFLVVLGSEMIVDWLKHAYIIKFNNVKPAVYKRFLDVLTKDYYSNAFVNQDLTKRLGLPVIPLSCLFIRASVQTYHMFLATHLPTSTPSTATELSLESAATSTPVTTAAFEHFDTIIRRALGRSAFGAGTDPSTSGWFFGTDDAIAALTMLIFFLGAFLVLLACKLVLGMCLLSFSRNKYKRMKEREKSSLDTQGKRVGGWGVVEVDDEKRRIIYEGDEEGLRKLKERERKMEKGRELGEIPDFSAVTRYSLSSKSKRIW